MTIGVNIQWGYAGLFNAGVMGFAALGGLAAVLVSAPPVMPAIEVGGFPILMGLLSFITTMIVSRLIWTRIDLSRIKKIWLIFILIFVGYVVMRSLTEPAIIKVEAVNPAKTGFLGGLGLPILLSWIVGAIFAAAVAWGIGKISLGLRSDYLAIATLGISEIIIYFLKNEDWLTRGVKNVSGLSRPVPYEINLQQKDLVVDISNISGVPIIEMSSILVKLSYSLLFAIALLIVFILSEKALKSPWGRMMRAIRDNETAASAIGKNVKQRHLQVFILGSAVIGLGGAMLTTLDGQFTPASYQPLRFTFLIWVMVIVGGSGNNYGSVIGGFLIWFFWIEAEPLGLYLIDLITLGLGEQSIIRHTLLENAAHMRLTTMGLILLLVLRFFPQGLIPERPR